MTTDATPWRGVLDNGLDVVVHPHAGGLAAVWLWLEAGAADEDVPGTAHFLEHMVFKGTSTRGVGDAARDVESLGGDLNAFTAHDETVLHATVAQESWLGVLEVVADLVRQPRLAHDEVARERDVILDEIRTYDDDPETVVQDAIHAALWPGHAYGRPVLGTAATVRTIEVGTLQAFWARQWSPHRARLIVVGDVSPDAVVTGARQFLGGWRRTTDRAAHAVAAAGGARCLLVTSDFATSTVQMAFPGPAAGHPDGPAIQLLCTALGEGQASRLQESLHHQEHLATDPWSEPVGMRLGGAITLGFQPHEGETMKACRTAIDVVGRLARRGLGPADLERARAQLHHDALFDDETADGLADRLAWSTARLGGLDGRERWRAALDAVTPTDLRRVAGTWFAPDRVVVAALDASLKDRDAHLLARPLRTPHRPASQQGDIHRLGNGVRLQVVVEPGRVAGIAAVALGGGLLADARSAGHGGAWAELLSWGAGDLDADAFGRASDAAGLQLDAVAGRSGVQVVGSFPGDAAAEALDLVGAALTVPAFARPDVSQVAEERAEDLDTLVDRPQEQLAEACWDLLFPGHPWRFPQYGTRASLRHIDHKAMQRFHLAHAAGDNLLVTLAGAVDPALAIDVLAPWLERLPPGGASEPARPGRTPAPERRVVRGGRGQATVQLAWRGLTWLDPQREALAMASWILGSQSGRLFLDLRERRALGYAVWANAWEGAVGGMVTAGVATDPRRVEEARDALRDGVGALVREPPSPEELARARRALVTDAISRRQRVVGRAFDSAMTARFGLALDFEGLRARLDNVGVDEVVAVWNALGTPAEVIALPS